MREKHFSIRFLTIWHLSNMSPGDIDYAVTELGKQQCH